MFLGAILSKNQYLQVLFEECEQFEPGIQEEIILRRSQIYFFLFIMLSVVFSVIQSLRAQHVSVCQACVKYYLTSVGNNFK